MRRLFDIAVAVMGLAVLSPLLLLLALAIKASSRGPAIYRATRVGRGGSGFTLYKFRSMYIDGHGASLTRRADPRITPIGRIIRRYKIDELPQLFNVLKGDMTLVGPRPEDPKYVALYSREEKRVLDVRPGITSPTALKYRHEELVLNGPDPEREYVDDIMRKKLRCDLEYLERRTFLSDLGVLWATAIAVLERHQTGGVEK